MSASIFRSGLTALLLLGLNACVTPQALRGDFAELQPNQAQPSANTTVPVRWGGTLLSMSNNDGISCLEVLARPLDATGRPERTREDLGRFLACQPGYKDPETYKTGRVITVVGYVTGTEVRKLGKDETRYAKLKAEQVYLWQCPDGTTLVYSYDPYFYPYDYPYPYYYSQSYYYYTPPVAQAPSLFGPNGAIMGAPTRQLPAVINPGGLLGGR